MWYLYVELRQQQEFILSGSQDSQNHYESLTKYDLTARDPKPLKSTDSLQKCSCSLAPKIVFMIHFTGYVAHWNVLETYLKYNEKHENKHNHYMLIVEVSLQMYFCSNLCLHDILA